MNTRWLLFLFISLILFSTGCKKSSALRPGAVFSYSAEEITPEEMGDPHVGQTRGGLELIGYWAGCGIGDDNVDPQLTRFAEGEIEIDMFVTEPPVQCIRAVYQRFSLVLSPLSPDKYHVQFRYHFPPSETEQEVINEVVTIR